MRKTYPNRMTSTCAGITNKQRGRGIQMEVTTNWCAGTNENVLHNKVLYHWLLPKCCHAPNSTIYYLMNCSRKLWRMRCGMKEIDNHFYEDILTWLEHFICRIFYIVRLFATSFDWLLPKCCIIGFYQSAVIRCTKYMWPIVMEEIDYQSCVMWTNENVFNKYAQTKCSQS